MHRKISLSTTHGPQTDLAGRTDLLILAFQFAGSFYFILCARRHSIKFISGLIAFKFISSEIMNGTSKAAPQIKLCRTIVSLGDFKP